MSSLTCFAGIPGTRALVPGNESSCSAFHLSKQLRSFWMSHLRVSFAPEAHWSSISLRANFCFQSRFPNRLEMPASASERLQSVRSSSPLSLRHCLCVLGLAVSPLEVREDFSNLQRLSVTWRQAQFGGRHIPGLQRPWEAGS